MKSIKLNLKKVIIVLFLGLGINQIQAQENEYFPDPNPVIQERLEEWKDLKFGLLMHWGTYSQWGVIESWTICPEDFDWTTGARKEGIADDNYSDYVKAYENLKTTFNPVKFDPEKWASAAKYAGMKYMVFTTKHHDGFCMFDSKYTDYKITDKESPFSSNPKSNIVKEVFSAFRKENLWIGAYFSKPDWHSDYYWWRRFPPSDRNCNYSIAKHPDQWKKFVDFTHNQIDELVSDYGKIDILWLDGAQVQKTTDEEVKKYLSAVDQGSRWTRNPQSQDIDMPRLVKEVRLKQPQLIVVDRAVPGEQQNYLTPEGVIPETGLPYPWETCMSMGTTWSYKVNDKYKTTNEIIEQLVDIVSKGGNYLLNVGPRPDGELEPVVYQRLKEIGDWIKTNGEAIYGSRMFTVFGEGEKIRFTQTKNGDTKYIFLFDFPEKKQLLTKITFSKNTKLQLLGSKSNLLWKQKGDAVEVSIPASLKGVSDNVWVIKVSN